MNVGVLWASRYQAGLPLETRGPAPGTAAAALLVAEPPTALPGFRLLHATSQEPTAWHVYELVER